MIKLILTRQGISDTLRTSDKCPLWPDYHTEINALPMVARKPLGLPYRVEVRCKEERSSHDVSSIESARRMAAAIIHKHIGEPAKFEPFVEVYCVGCEREGDRYITHCLWDEKAKAIVLHSSKFRLVGYVDGVPQVQCGDPCYLAIVTEAVRTCIAQNCKGNTPIWLTWLISEWINRNVMSRYQHKEPRFIAPPKCRQDWHPIVRSSLIR